MANLEQNQKPLEVHYRDCTVEHRAFGPPCDCPCHKQIVMVPPPQPGEGPPCIWDNAPTRRAGSCWVCPMCGATTSC